MKWNCVKSNTPSRSHQTNEFQASRSLTYWKHGLSLMKMVMTPKTLSVTRKHPLSCGNACYPVYGGKQDAKITNASHSGMVIIKWLSNEIFSSRSADCCESGASQWGWVIMTGTCYSEEQVEPRWSLISSDVCAGFFFAAGGGSERRAGIELFPPISVLSSNWTVCGDSRGERNLVKKDPERSLSLSMSFCVFHWLQTQHLVTSKQIDLPTFLRKMISSLVHAFVLWNEPSKHTIGGQ